MTPHVEDRERTDLETCLGEIDEALTEVLEARGVHYVAEATCSPVALPLVHTVNRLLRQLEEIGRFVLPLSRGELSAPLPSPDNRMAAPLVEMHARLRQLTRQTQEIARGDYTQRIDFMGEFSEAFNAMVVLLEERERTLTDEIARRRQAEDELQRERDLLVAGPVVTFRWGVDDDGTVEYVSPNVSAYGYAPEEFTSGRRVYASIVDPADIGWINEDGNDKSRAGLDSWTQEYRIIDAEGETHWVRDFTHTVRDADGAATAYEGYIIDITAQKAAETALRQREEQLRMLSLSDGLTGLYNRRGLFALGEHVMRSARRRAGGLGVDLRRRRRAQGHQRPLRARPGRRSAVRGGRRDPREHPRVGRGGARRRRRVRRPGRGRPRRDAGAGRPAAPPDGPRQREVGAAVPHLAEHRRRRLGAGRAGHPAGAHRARRPAHARRQAGEPALSAGHPDAGGP